MDKDSGAIFVDRFMKTAMNYPCNYGFIPGTLGGDGDPIDVLVISPYPLLPCSVIASRPIGVLLMEDESGMDEKIIAVPITKLHSDSSMINSLDDVSVGLKKQIIHFFESYKDLDENKWVKVKGWGDLVEAKRLIIEAFEAAKK
jgi:inorganic pyrophosphatase